MASQDTGGENFDIGNDQFSPAEVGTLQSVTSFASTAPYLGVGYDFELLGKVGLNFDFGVLWQGEPSVSLEATGPAASQALQDALLTERQELEDEMTDFKAWPVVSVAFIYNF